MTLNSPPCLGSGGLRLDRWLDLDRLRSARGGVRCSAAAAAGSGDSDSSVGIGKFLVALARPVCLFVGLPIL